MKLRIRAAAIALALCAAAGLLGSRHWTAGGLAKPEFLKPGDPAFRERAALTAADLDLASAAAQVLLIGVEGVGRPAAQSLELLSRLPVGGVILFGFNMPERPADLADYTAALQDAASARNATPQRGVGTSRGDAPSRLPLIVALDHEGGSVFRFKGSGITRIPPAAEVGARGPSYARMLGEIGGAQLRALGVNMALAPVVELLDDRNQRFLGSRSYGRNARIVDRAAGAYLEGLQTAGAAAVAKHFPGNADADPHERLPSLPINLKTYKRDFEPRFAQAIDRGVAGIMLSHVVCPALDPDKPATISSAFAQAALKKKLGFKGVVLTDDLYMKALTEDSPPERTAVEALAAGADLLMLTWNGRAESVRDAIVRAVKDGRLDRERLYDAARRVVELKLRYGMSDDLDSEIRAQRARTFPALVADGNEKLRAGGS
ncbi:MAG: glycoside hydrolase family 3 N-terminal domain-containing protein [Spirochaetaceae bacterium]|nr:glycoside hydrolase family 3 N-terminal domain-containing protein [Spirochaetaceae bacterium]